MTDDRSTAPINVDYFEDLTGKIDPGTETTCDHIGARIQKIREQKRDLARGAFPFDRFDREMLEKIEKGDVCPQLGTVIKLSKALDSASSG